MALIRRFEAFLEENPDAECEGVYRVAAGSPGPANGYLPRKLLRLFAG